MARMVPDPHSESVLRLESVRHDGGGLERAGVGDRQGRAA